MVAAFLPVPAASSVQLSGIPYPVLTPTANFVAYRKTNNFDIPASASGSLNLLFAPGPTRSTDTCKSRDRRPRAVSAARRSVVGTTMQQQQSLARACGVGAATALAGAEVKCNVWYGDVVHVDLTLAVHVCIYNSI